MQKHYLTRRRSIDLMPQSRHKKERFSPKGDEFEPERVAKSREQIDRFPPQAWVKEKAPAHRATDGFQVVRLV
jgi:hypothetical protein